MPAAFAREASVLQLSRASRAGEGGRIISINKRPRRRTSRRFIGEARTLLAGRSSSAKPALFYRMILQQVALETTTIPAGIYMQPCGGLMAMVVSRGGGGGDGGGVTPDL